MKSTIFILLIALFSVLISCEKETHENPYKGLLKRKLHYRSNQDSIPMSISDYEYDSKLRLKKVQTNLHTELFEYNQNDKLIRKFTYQIIENVSTLTDSTIYQYQNGNLIFEESIQVPVADNSSSAQTRYEYENSKLVRKKYYQDHHFWGMTSCEYSNNLLTKEIHFTDSIGTKIQSYVKYLYDENKLSMAALVEYSGGVNQGLTLLAVYYIYDEDGNLVIENAEQSEETSAWLTYCYRYEYY
jgi:hypothetical protein